MYSDNPKAKRFEFRCPDPTCNPYLAFAAMLMAGLDGVRNRIEPPDPVDEDLYDLAPEVQVGLAELRAAMSRGPGTRVRVCTPPPGPWGR